MTIIKAHENYSWGGEACVNWVRIPQDWVKKGNCRNLDPPKKEFLFKPEKSQAFKRYDFKDICKCKQNIGIEIWNTKRNSHVQQCCILYQHKSITNWMIFAGKETKFHFHASVIMNNSRLHTYKLAIALLNWSFYQALIWIFTYKNNQVLASKRSRILSTSNC